MARQVVSLALELSDIESAVRGGQQLIEQVGLNVMSGPADAQAGLGRADAILGLVAARLRLLRAVVRGEADPLVLLTPENSVSPRTAQDDHDLELRPWDPADRAAHARGELERAEAQVAGGSRRRRT